MKSNEYINLSSTLAEVGRGCNEQRDSGILSAAGEPGPQPRSAPPWFKPSSDCDGDYQVAFDAALSAAASGPSRLNVDATIEVRAPGRLITGNGETMWILELERADEFLVIIESGGASCMYGTRLRIFGDIAQAERALLAFRLSDGRVDAAMLEEVVA